MTAAKPPVARQDSSPAAEQDDIYRIFTEKSADGLLVIDDHGYIRYANPAAIALFSPASGTLIDSHIGVPSVLHPTEIQIPRPDGIRHIELMASEILWDKAKATLTSLRDVTERNQNRQELMDALAQFRGVVEQSVAGIYIVQNGRLAYINPRFAEILGYTRCEELVGREIFSIVAESDRDIVSKNIQRRISGEIDSCAYETRLLRKDGSIVDVGVHGSAATLRGQPAIIGLMQDITSKKQAERDSREYLSNLEASLMGTVGVAVNLSAIRDPYNASHQRRVAEIAAAIGVEMGFDANRQQGLRIAGMLHDIGKMSVPAEILVKPGRLSALEYILVQNHTVAGYDILKAVKFQWPVAEIALQHHERMDGSGYPKGLKGDEILQESRIIAVADVIEAMSSHRPYRPSLGIHAALTEIESGRGNHYDPAVTDACMRLFREKGYVIPE
ncbi:MAG: PAS domain S-box protein [Burkholderiales bacterium]|nr:PAS domain S-box protein [Burkholderiales bacterium]MDP2396984.1 PAS domain S-box protein [Burkholderiales bacterium]